MTPYMVLVTAGVTIGIVAIAGYAFGILYAAVALHRRGGRDDGGATHDAT